MADVYETFTRAHRLFVHGMRRGMRERLELQLGDSWWESGAWPALTVEQQGNLRVGMSRERRYRLKEYLDTPHFAGITRRNHATCFVDAFPDLQVTNGRLGRLTTMRHEWAHVTPGGFEPRRAAQALDDMLALLVALQLREAIEVKQMSLNVDRDASGLGTPVSVDGEKPRDNLLTVALWRDLRSFLAMDFAVEEMSQSPRRKKVTVRVTNTAPAGEGQPRVHFNDVNLTVIGARLQQHRVGALSPGQTETAELVLERNELASVQFAVSGRVDVDRFWDVRRNEALPPIHVAALSTSSSTSLRNSVLVSPWSKRFALYRP
ncbi:MAG: hypothetical protein FJ318_02270 [SAR202 cluster bacterium]|nr:hypothetical protein [SAR202 cluster bacterium]